MRGLITKDIKLIKKQKSFGIIFAAVILFYLFSDINTLFINGYACLVGMIFIVGTISYDEMDNGNAFLFTLPFERKTYVREKYLLTVLVTAAVWIFSFFAAAAAGMLQDSRTVPADQIIPALLILAAAFFFASLMLPIQLKFGGNRGVLGLIFSIFAAAFIVILAAKLLDFIGVDSQERLNLFRDFLAVLSPGILSLICLAASALCLFFSHHISNRIIERKEF